MGIYTYHNPFLSMVRYCPVCSKPDSGQEFIGELCLAVKVGATLEDLGSTVHPHPTLSEAISEAAEACLGQALHILTPSRA